MLVTVFSNCVSVTLYGGLGGTTPLATSTGLTYSKDISEEVSSPPSVTTVSSMAVGCYTSTGTAYASKKIGRITN